MGNRSTIAPRNQNFLSSRWEILLALNPGESVRKKKVINASLAPLLAVVFTLSLAIAMYSQVTGATLSGTITDPSGGAIPGAQIFRNI
jgi:hypothetical protein